MKWYFKVLGGHTHVRVFMNGAKCGDLCFSNEEFTQIKEHAHLLASDRWLIQLLPDDTL